MRRRGAGRLCPARHVAELDAGSSSRGVEFEGPHRPVQSAILGNMTRRVECVLLGIEAEGLDRPPYPGELGQRIFDNVSREAWQRWIKHQTMLLNEYRLTPIDPKARKFLVEEMEKFFFGEGSQRPQEFVDPESQQQ